jgi:peptide/nickel transport system substrate-binding protein
MDFARRVPTLWAMVMLCALVAACAPAAQPSAPASQSSAPQGASGATTVASRGPKVLTIAFRQELLSFGDFTGLGSSGGGNRIIRGIAHNYLSIQDDTYAWRPQLATELPSVEKGTWKFAPDGSMELTWKIRPNVKWQDGTPFTASDLVFAYTLHKDPQFTLVTGGSQVRLMESVEAPDPHTLVVRWSRTLVDATQGFGLDPMPRHLLEPLYQAGDKDALINSPLLSSNFVGLGPYRITNWQSGVEIQFERFDDYYLGRPPLDRVIAKYIKDGNTMVANALAGSVDVVMPPNIDLDIAKDLQRQWQGTGNQVISEVTNRMRFLRPQYRAEFARPLNASNNVTVRRALLHGIDRGLLTEVVGHGLVPIADGWIMPNEVLYPQVQSAIPQYSYDLNRAQQLLTEAGWVKGSDGVLVHQATGQRFETELGARPTTGADKDVAVIADGWKPLGIAANLYLMPAALADDREHIAKQPFMTHGSLPAVSFYDASVTHSREIATEGNRWGGRNTQGYNNPALDGILDRLIVTVDERQRVDLHRQLLQEGMGDVAFVPLYWQADPILLVKGVKGIRNSGSWNMYEWDKE